MADLTVKGSSLEWRITLPEGAQIELKHQGFLHRCVDKIWKKTHEWKSGFVGFWKRIVKMGLDDPRRIFHSIKVGISLALVSLFYFLHPLFRSTGGTAVWAVMTVVVIFEFTAGATLSKGLNRICATLLGGILAVGVNFAADCAGHRAEPYILGSAVFFQSAASTFARFYPILKQRYDYGLLIFILTFSFMAVSGYRVENLFEESYQRLGTVIVGCVLCLLISLLVCPIWAGEDLHKLIIHNMEALAQSCKACVEQYFRESSEEEGDNDVRDKASNGYKCVLNSKATEESLANFARWEPPHGEFCFRYPWKQYVKIGAAMRYCAYCVEALNGCINSETMATPDLRSQLKAPCMNIASECSNILLELADSIATMTTIIDVDLMIDRLNGTVEELENSLTSQPELFIDSKRWQILGGKKSLQNEFPQSKSPHQVLVVKNVETEEKGIGLKTENINQGVGVGFMDTLAVATVACLLREIVARLGSVIEAVHELGQNANFKPVEEKVQAKTAPPPLSATKHNLPAGIPPLPVEMKVQVDVDNVPHHSSN